MAADYLPLLILIGRPASGKSEIIGHLLGLPASRRRAEFHMGELVVLDDFPYLWAWLEEDSLLEHRLGQPRLHTDPKGYFLYPHLWDLLVERLLQEYLARSAEAEDAGSARSYVLEFSRGSEHGGYRRALARLGEAILRRAAVMYVRVSFEESLRKNRRRFNPARPGSILEHSLPDEKMSRLYRDDDWSELTRGHATHLTIKNRRLPYVLFDNNDDVTTGKPEMLDRKLQERLTALYELRLNTPPN